MNAPQQGFSLSALFVLMTACAALIGGVTPLVRQAGDGDVNWWTLGGALAAGLCGTVLLALVIGIFQYARIRSMLLGMAAGAFIGLTAGLIALLPMQSLGTSALAMLIGSGLIVAVALLNRRVNG
jgi:hypothetical protein